MSTSTTTSRRAPLDLLSGVWGGLALTSGVALTATSGWLIVRASERPVILTLLTAIVSVRAFGMARPFFRYLERVRSHDSALAGLAGARTDVYAALIPLTPARLGRRSRSAVLSGVVDDLTDVVEAHVRVRVPLWSAALAATFTTILTAALVPTAGVVVLSWVAAVGAVTALGLHLERASQPVLGAARAEVSRVAELVGRHTGELQAIGAEGEVLDQLDRAQVSLDRALRRQCRGRALVTGGVLTLTGLATLAMARVAVEADISAGVAALLVVVPAALADALLPLADAVRARARAEQSGDRVTALLDQAPAVAGAGTIPPTSTAPHLRLDAVGAGWVDGRLDVGPVTLDLPPGQRTAIVGANGSGKSTLLAVLARALDPRSGRYLVDGHDVLDLALDDVRDLIAVVDDEPHIFAADLRANLVLAHPKASDEDIVDALRVAGLTEWFAALPDGLGTRLGTGGRGVSGGERARLALARAVLSRRPVVLLDEPVAHLDHPTAAGVMRDVWAATSGRTVVLVSHRHEGLDDVDVVVDLSPGTKE
ncbi:ABC transporter ATP-binding protein [Knoellia sinensis KCTC 19936]|uniref:ABC transporter ATP-binding protein n=1 Tax=Knoellia sinensis KCTC 19936 TaxID=1385520 RepID=A0A0A0J7U8_9MICO|nr:thiol reductant ABC exporter subunit CydC [Knoellia sinensis]KGN31691.1 ABC transporter ATP-binding protein [Knoellia sinensis KCTC 19936]